MPRYIPLLCISPDLTVRRYIRSIHGGVRCTDEAHIENLGLPGIVSVLELFRSDRLTAPSEPPPRSAA